MTSLRTYDWAVLAEFSSQWGIDLSADQRALIEKFLDDLINYNAKTNLTADAEPGLLLTRHVADAFVAIKCLRETLAGAQNPQILDLGAGGGLIGLPLKIVWPEAQVTLMESSRRKFDFLNYAAIRLGLKGIRVVHERGGALPSRPQGKGYDAVIARAVAPISDVLLIGLRLLAPGGALAVYRSENPEEGQEDLSKAMALRGAQLKKSWPYRLPGESKDRYFAIFG